MAIVNFLQRHCKALTRALLESSLDIKELGGNEDASKPELIYKLSDSSGYRHFAALEWLNAQLSTNAGAKEIGVWDDTFAVLSGAGTVQEKLKELDTFLTIQSGTYSPTVVGATGPFSVKWWVFNNTVWLKFSGVDGSDDGNTNFEFTDIPAAITPPANIFVTGLRVYRDGDEYFGAMTVTSGGKFVFEYNSGSGGVLFDNIFGAFDKGILDGVVSYPLVFS